MINIIGVDPGGITGIAHLVSNQPPSFHQLTPRGAEQWISAYLEVWEDARIPRPMMHIVCEKYQITGRSVRATAQSDASDVGGAIQALCANCRYTQFHWQTPADGKMITDYVLQRTGLKPLVRMPHAADAARHAALLLLKLYPRIYQNLLTHGTLIEDRSNYDSK